MIDILNQQEVEFIQDDVLSVLEDCDFPGGSRDIIYRRRAGSSFNPSTGQVEQTVVDTTIRAFLGNHSAAEIANSGGILQIGDIFFMFAPSRLASFPQPDDQILEEITDLGNIRLTQGLASVVGYNTQFRIAGVQGGDVLVAGGVTLSVKEVTTDEALTLKSNWTPATVPAGEFKIYRIFEIVNRIVDPLRAAYKLSARRAGA